MRHDIILLIFLLLVTGCSTQPMTDVIVQPNAPMAIPTTQPLTLSPVQWQVMSLSQLKKLVTDLQASDQQVVLFSLDTKNFNNLSLNLIEFERYINEQKAILLMLKKIVAARTAASAAPTESSSK